MLDRIHKERKAVAAGQAGLFDTASQNDSLPNVAELSSHELLSFEKELLGFYLTAHPLEKMEISEKDMAHMTRLSYITDERIGDRVKVLGLITQVKKIMTRTSNSEMAFTRIEDLTGTIEAVVFPKIYARTSPLWVRDGIVVVSGKVDKKEDRLMILVDDVSEMPKSR